MDSLCVGNKNANKTFGMKFVNNKAFSEVVDYAANTKKMSELDTALNTLKKANKGDVLIIHGTTPDNRVYSNFNMNKHAVQNLGAKTPAEASYNAILDLSQLGRKFRKLVGGDVKTNITKESINKEYTV